MVGDVWKKYTYGSQEYFDMVLGKGYGSRDYYNEYLDMYLHNENKINCF